MADKPNPMVDETKRFEIQRALDEIARLESDGWWNTSKLFRLCATICPTDEDYRDMQNFVLYTDYEEDVPENDREYFDEVFRTLFIRRVWEQVNKKLQGMDDLTRVAAMSAFPSERTKVYDYKYYTPVFFTEALQSPGTFGMVFSDVGQMLGVGKSDTSCLMMENHVAQGEPCCTNIIIDDMPEGVVQVFGLKDMLRVSIENLFRGKTTKSYLDELPQIISKERGTTKEWVNMKKLLYLERKVGNSLVGIAQRVEEIPYAIQDMAIWHIQKKEKTVMDFRSMNTTTRIIHVPRTSLKFKTGHPGSFTAEDLDIEAMHDHIIGVEKEARNTGNRPDVLKVILEYLDMDARQITRADYKAFAKVCYLNIGLSQKEIASYCEIDGRAVSQQTVSNWLASMGIT